MEEDKRPKNEYVYNVEETPLPKLEPEPETQMQQTKHRLKMWTRFDIFGKISKPKCSCRGSVSTPCCLSGHKSKCSDNFRMVKKMWPCVVAISCLELIIGLILLISVRACALQYDRMYATEKSKVISTTSTIVAVSLLTTGLILLMSVILDKRRAMLSSHYVRVVEELDCLDIHMMMKSVFFYICLATIMCVFFFIFAIMKIHYALKMREKEPYNPTQHHTYFLKSPSCIIGMLTILGSVIHFVANVIVFMYYNFKYIHLTMFNCGP